MISNSSAIHHHAQRWGNSSIPRRNFKSFDNLANLRNTLKLDEISLLFNDVRPNIVVQGKFVNHKGRNRHFTSAEELEEERKAEESKKWRKKKTEGESDDEESGSEEEAGSNDSEEESESEDDHKKSGVHGLIEIENPNRIQKKQVLKVSTLDIESGAPSSSSSSAAASSAPQPPAELSRREREEIERQKKQANYQKLHAQGKTEQAKADLARLAIIKQQREEAARLRDLKKKEAEAKSNKGGK